jgi:cytochrome c556
MKPHQAFTLLIAGLLLQAPATAQFRSSENAIKYRQGAFAVMGAHFSRIAMMAQGIQPFDARSVADNTEVVSNLARLPFSAFGPGTDHGAPHRASAEVWKDPARFKLASERMVSEIGKLELAAKAGNPDAIKQAAGAVGQSCKACHDDFRGPTRE